MDVLSDLHIPEGESKETAIQKKMST